MDNQMMKMRDLNTILRIYPWVGMESPFLIGSINFTVLV